MKFVALLVGAIAALPLFYFFWIMFGSSIFVLGLIAAPLGISWLYNAVYISKGSGPAEQYQVWTLKDK